MKLDKHAWILWGIALIVTIVLMILIPFAYTATWWIAACCTVLMFGLCAFTFVRAFRKDETLESKLLGWPIFKVGYTALIAQFVVGAILMGIAAFTPAWVAGIAELLVFAVTGFCLTAKDAAREVVTQSEAKTAEKTAAWKMIRATVSAIATETGNPEIIKLAEVIRLADPTPTSMDATIAEIIESLRHDANDGTIKKAFQLMEQRKVLAKLEK